MFSSQSVYDCHVLLNHLSCNRTCQVLISMFDNIYFYTFLAEYCELPPADELIIEISETYVYSEKRVIQPAVVHFR